jgi:hypothetical protein
METSMTVTASLFRSNIKPRRPQASGTPAPFIDADFDRMLGFPR